MNRQTLIIAGLILGVVLVGVALSRGKNGSSENGARSSKGNVQQLHQQAQAAVKNGELLQAKEIYKNILENYPDANDIDTIQQEMESVSVKIILSNTPVPNKIVIHEVKNGDSYVYRWLPDGTVVTLLNGQENGSIKSEKFAKALWSVWFGKPSAVDRNQLVANIK